MVITVLNNGLKYPETEMMKITKHFFFKDYVIYSTSPFSVLSCLIRKMKCEFNPAVHCQNVNCIIMRLQFNLAGEFNIALITSTVFENIV